MPLSICCVELFDVLGPSISALKHSWKDMWGKERNILHFSLLEKNHIFFHILWAILGLQLPIKNMNYDRKANISEKFILVWTFHLIFLSYLAYPYFRPIGPLTTLLSYIQVKVFLLLDLNALSLSPVVERCFTMLQTFQAPVRKEFSTDVLTGCWYRTS